MRTRRALLASAAAAATALGLTLTPGSGSAAPAPTGAAAAPAVAPSAAPVGGGTALLRQYAADTWRSFTAMTVPSTGLPADNIGGDLDPSDRSAFTSPTNIGAYLWSTVAARDIGLISKAEAHDRMAQTLATLATLERHEDSGMFYNWYDPTTLEKLRVWPENGSTVYPFLSSVDNGWLATGLLLTSRADPSLAAAADAIRSEMDFGFYYNPAENVGGQIRGGFWDEEPPGCSVLDNYRDRGPDVYYTCHHYGAFNTEPRIASYLGIASGQIPPRHYFGTFRTFPPTCGFNWTETLPTGQWREYLGVPVFEGALPYRGMKIVPSWGGSMFEALMVPLFVPEESWGPRSWGVTHPLYVQGQIEHGLEEAAYGYWGFSPSNNPDGGYREYGVDQLGLDEPGYTSDQQRTTVPQAYDLEGCARPAGEIPTEFGDGVVTPHASFLALRYTPVQALRNLKNIADDFDAYGPGGFYDAVEVTSGDVSKRYLSLDQGMIMAALGNALADDDMRRYVARGAMAEALRPLMRMEVFSAAPR
jgi:hypothetical protein